MSSNDKRIFQLHAEICQTFSTPIRLDILSKLRYGKKSVNEIAALTGIRQATVSQHLAVLRQRFTGPSYPQIFLANLVQQESLEMST